jgi:hypothetical protein
MISGSSITNTATTGLPSVTTDIAYSFAVTAQSFVNPSHTPTNAYLEFAIDGGLMTNDAATTYGHNYLGFALPAQLNDFSQWLPTRYVSTGGVWAVSFGRRLNNSKQIAVFADGAERAVVARPQAAQLIDTVQNAFVVSLHTFITGDPVRVTSTGTLPNGITDGAIYYVAQISANAIGLAETPAQAAIADLVGITTTGTGVISVNPADTWRLERTGLTGQCQLFRNDNAIYTYGTTTVATLRGFYASREAMAASSPVFSGIKVFGGI